ncbi:MAG TPA: PASTA domain-containing protein [Nitrospira sp.]|nr:PASTA domain-containing protein [Nitrospira sp.]
MTIHETVTAAPSRSVIPEPPPPVTVAESPTASSPAGTQQSWTMPDLRGRNLQDAQDTIQALTANEVFYTGSTDLTGQGRNQVLDRNWQVCTSTPAPGETFTKDSVIDFGVVRIDSESCP